MYNWSVDTKVLKKSPKEYKLWRLEQLVNFGLGKEKISKKDVAKYVGRIKIDPLKEKYLKFLLGK